METEKRILTFVADISNISDDEYEKIYRNVPKFRQKKADVLRNRDARIQSVAVWYLYMMAKKKYQIGKDHNFNLSHSGKYVLCSIGPKDEKIGCDVEMLGVCRENVAKRFFCESESARICGTEEEKIEMFYRIWVLKESFMKATRKGMALGMNEFEIVFTKEGRPKIQRYPDWVKEEFFYKEYELRDGKVAVCSTLDAFSIRPEFLKFS